MPPTDPAGFESSLKALEQSVAALESGALDLDAALAAYEAGVRHLARCHGLLDAAEQKVRQLTVAEDGTPTLAPFEPSGDGAGA
jgi:exodeoxyribonuclease VII small subunit